MQRYFVDTVDHDTDHFIISGENARHISKVMRMTAGEEIIVVHDNVAYICEIIELDQDVHAKNRCNDSFTGNAGRCRYCMWLTERR